MCAISVGGRSLTIYEEVHSIHRYGYRHAHRGFLNALRTLLPEGVEPIMVTDAGFRSTRFADVEAMGWHWVGRIRNRDFVWFEQERDWKFSKTLHPTATTRPKALGTTQLVRYRPLLSLIFILETQTRTSHTCLIKPNFARRARAEGN